MHDTNSCLVSKKRSFSQFCFQAGKADLTRVLVGVGVHWTGQGPCRFRTMGRTLGQPSVEKLTQWPHIGAMSLLSGLEQGQGSEPEREGGGSQLECSSSQLGRVPKHNTCTRTSSLGQSCRESPTT